MFIVPSTDRSVKSVVNAGFKARDSSLQIKLWLITYYSVFCFFLHSLTWTLFFIFTFLHLYANFRAVSSVIMETVSLPRLHLLVTEFLSSGHIMTPQEVGSREPVIFGEISFSYPQKFGNLTINDIK